ncbi:IS1595 family transposase [Novosphingobium mangrovi (ex Hu et al. 2023)]|uniref:IS1595 family transposase n=1 Tax=Novosphingobium mangrovi (ex Hu et al. 2023) TaxID=2930094 RepID=A0ABT0AI57_9SPHN|nr:IS1595 family transposase [Novosphingobium mangrovi (ex Hu et al. 2023)]MCJ1962881.1 IS1595 family transposase [Novosphingobium mangrovi (ex Hu et al. 2023)]
METSAPKKQQFTSLIQMMRAMPDEQSAIDHFTAIRWKHGAYCPHCGATKVYHFKDGRTHKCGECRKRFSIKVGTIFEDSKIGLREWMLAVWLLTNHKKGIASTQLATDIGVTQKTAWFMLHRLRYAAQTKSFNRPLDGEIEADETFIGGKEKNKHASKRTGGKQGGKGKAIVLGILKRDGDLVTGTLPNLRAKNVQGAINSIVAPGSTVMTDEHVSFNGLSDRFTHHRVNHSAGEYVRNYCLHTNGIESVWALFKRQVIGTHHWLSPKHLSRYLNEMTWRFNQREIEAGERVNALLEQTAGRLTYKELIA